MTLDSIRNSCDISSQKLLAVSSNYLLVLDEDDDDDAGSFAILA